MTHNINKLGDLNGIVRQTSADEDLRFLSQTPRQPLHGSPFYAYRRAEKQVFIYTLDLGILPHHTEFRGRSIIEWLFGPLTKYKDRDTKTDDDIPGGHGTCVASKAIGNTFGAAKQATLVVIKLADTAMASLLDGLNSVIRNVTTKGRRGYGIILLTYHLHQLARNHPIIPIGSVSKA